MVNHELLETAILGNILTYKDAILLIADKLKPDHFITEKYAQLYQACLDMMHKGLNPDIVGIRKRIKGEINDPELVEISSAGFKIKNIEDAASQLILMWQEHETQLMCQEVLGGMVDDSLEHIEGRILELREETSTGSEPIEDVVERMLKEKEAAYAAHQRGEMPENTVLTGITELDRRNGGFRPGDLVIVAGRPSMGKSMLMRLLAMNMQERHPVKLFTGEMGKEKLTELMSCTIAEIDSVKVRNLDLRDDEYAHFVKSALKIAEMDIKFDGLGTLMELMVSVKKWRMRTDMSKPGVILIDYMQLMKTGIKEIDRSGMYAIVSEVSRSLKKLAVDMNLVVIALAQLSRAVESRGGDKRPALSDLRESGQIEQDADVVLFLYRPEYYGFETDDEGNSTLGMMEGIYAKFRDGVPGTAKMQAILKYGIINSWSYEGATGFALESEFEARRQQMAGYQGPMEEKEPNF